MHGAESLQAEIFSTPLIRILAAGVLVYFVAAATVAQLVTDQVPRQRIVPVEDAVKAQVDKSRFRLGPFRLLPTVIVSNAGYDNNVFGTPETCPPITGCGRPKTADWSATVSAGTRVVAPLGAKIYFRGDALPEYTWYRSLTERRNLGGLYRGSVLGFFNRMSFEVGGYFSKAFGFLTSETETRVVENLTDASANLEVDLGRAISIYGGAETLRMRNSLRDAVPSGPVDIRSLDRDDGAGRAGLRYRISSQWDVTVGVEGTRSEFVERPEQADNQSLAYLLGIHYGRPRFFVNLSGGYRRGRPLNGSTFPEYSTTTGSYFVSYFLTPRVEIQSYGHRAISYGSLFPIPTYFIETRYGGALNFEIHPRVLLHGYGEYGTNDYPVPQLLEEKLTKRSDKYSAFGGGFSARVYRNVVFSGLVNQYRYESLFPGLARTVLRYTTSLSFEGQLAR